MLLCLGKIPVKQIMASTVFGFSLCLLQPSLIFADASSLPGEAPATASNIAAPLSKMLKSSRQSTTLSYLPYMEGLTNTNQPLVHVLVNGTLSASFFLDTGFNHSIISDKITNQLALKRYPITVQGKPYQFDGKPANAVIPDTIDLNGFKFTKPVFVVVSEKTALLPKAQVDGILGIDFVQKCGYLFDFPQHEITIFAPTRLATSADGSAPTTVTDGFTPEELSKLGFATAKSASLTKSDTDGRIYVRAQCSNLGKSGSEELLLDTGSEITTVSPSLARQLGLKATSENVSTFSLSGGGYISTAPLDRLQIGSLILDHQSIQYSSQPAYDKNVPLSLGMDILSKYQVLVDFTNQKVYFKPGVATVPLPTITIKPQ